MEEFKSKLFCPYCLCFWIYDIKIKSRIDHKEIIATKCYHCEKLFYILRNMCKVYLSRSLETSDLIYKYPITVKEKYKGMLRFEDPFGKTVEECKIALKTCSVLVVNMATVTPQIVLELALAEQYSIKRYIVNPGIEGRNEWLKSFSLEMFEKVEPCYDEILKTIVIKTD